MSTVLPANGYVPRHYQRGFWKWMQSHPWDARAILCHHRRAGKDHTAINWCAVAAHQRPGLYVHIFPYANQARRVIWNGIDRNGVRFLSAFPEELIERSSDLEMRLHLKNGSVYQVIGADDPDRLVGINCVGAIFSEYALMDPKALDLVMPILNENRGWAVFPSTPRGENHFHRLIENAKRSPEKWYVSIETVETTGAVKPEAIEEERARGVEEALIQQEYYCSFSAPLQGAYYEKQMAAVIAEERLGKSLYDAALPVHTAWDFGVDDSTTIWFFQQANDKSVRLIDYYEASGEGMGHYVRICTEKSTKGNWTFGTHYGPHDVMQRQMGVNVQTKWETALSLGLRFVVVPKHEVEEGIEACRQLIAKCWFDEKKAARGIECLKSYRKEWDERLKVYRNKPRHDEYSHGADAFRYLAMGIRTKGPRSKDADRKTQTESSYDVFA